MLVWVVDASGSGLVCNGDPIEGREGRETEKEGGVHTLREGERPVRTHKERQGGIKRKGEGVGGRQVGSRAEA